MSPLYRRIGPYEVCGELGSGGMADVFVARDTRTGATVALKVPRRDADIRLAEREGALLQRHLAERDARVARVFEIGEDDGVPYIAMEFVAGEDLSERIARGPLAPGEAVRIALELCDLLAAAHASAPVIDGRARRGIVHGDLKPRNVRLEPGGRVRVVDFGIAKALSETRKRTHNEFGSLPYSSPERADTGNVDAHSDLWAVAVVLYEMLAGRHPFGAENPRQLERAILARSRPGPLPGHCPPALDAVMRKALAPDLGRRYAGAAELGCDLDAAVCGGTTSAEIEEREQGDPWQAAAAGVAAASDAGSASAPPASGEGTTHRSPSGDEATHRSVPADEATHRTVAEPDEATRRTQGGAGAEPTRRTSGETGPTAAAMPAPASRTRSFVRTAKLAAVVAALALVANEVTVIQAAGDLESRLPDYGRTEWNPVWARYRALRERDVLHVGTWRLGWKVKNWLVAAADDLVADYLSDTPTIRERGWRQATALLRRAQSIAPNDSKVRARLRYCEGQLARIDGEARLERGASAGSHFNSARRAFEEAAHLRRGWPDPYLGLARVLTFGYQDVDRTRDAVEQAERAGYRPGNRETALIADAHRLRAEKTWKAVPGLPDEERYLERIRDDCYRALDLYDQVPAYAQVNLSIRRVHALLARVAEREDSLAHAADSAATAPPGVMDEPADPSDTTVALQ